MYNRHLETFICVADLGSFSKAAEALYISSTAVIKQINLLEQELGLQLLERTHRGISLTRAGRSIYGDAKYLIQYSKDSLTRANNAMQSEEKIIKIGSSLMTPAQFILELWSKIKVHCPGIKFQIVPFENTPENAREILANLGTNIDIVAGWFDEFFLDKSGCQALKLEDEPISCALSINHSLAFNERIKISDLYGENVMLIKRGWNKYTDAIRDELWSEHTHINIIDVPFFNVDVFNQCESSNDILIGFRKWENVHPLLRIVPIEWDYTIPYGILHSPTPSEPVSEFLEAVSKIF
ncbi:MAG: LysR family transcriptional regulator [bacterium]|nr:LysR family transcriptional regulator [bacterium]